MSKMVKAIKEAIDWQEAAPKWFLLCIIAVQFSALGGASVWIWNLQTDRDRIREELIKHVVQEVKDNTENRLVLLEFDKKHVWEAIEWLGKTEEERRRVVSGRRLKGE